MHSAKVICLGEALVDRLGPLGGDPRLDKPFQDCLGGAPANVACGLARLGVNAAFVGCLGKDSIGDQFHNLFLSRGVNINCLQKDEKTPSRIVLVRRDLNGERTFGGFIGGENNMFADHSLNLCDLQKRWLSMAAEARWLLLGTILLAKEQSRQVVRWACDQAIQQGIKIAIDLNWRPTFWDANLSPETPPDEKICALINPFLEDASLLKMAEEEALWFFQSKDPAEISKSLPKKPSVVITDGSNPINWLLGDFQGVTKASSPSEVIDTTGAGDSFMSGLLHQILFYSFNPQSASQAKNAIRFAAACGALVCTGAGAIEPQPTLLEVEKFLQAFDHQTT